jgi:hypothetical protein
MEEEQGGRPIKYLRDANLIGEAESVCWSKSAATGMS